MNDTTSKTEPVNAPGSETVPVTSRKGADVDTGSAGRLAWGARSDVGLVRDHNEDAFWYMPHSSVCATAWAAMPLAKLQAPLQCVA